MIQAAIQLPVSVEKDWLSAETIAQRLDGISVRTLDRWVATGVFPPPDIRKGKKFRWWTRATYEAWLEGAEKTGVIEEVKTNGKGGK